LNGETKRLSKKQSSAIIAVDVRRFACLINTDEDFGTHSGRRRRIRGRLSGRIFRIRVIMDLLETSGKDLPLRDDIRLLGRILGDTAARKASLSSQ
jgi:hypothetical protein